MQPFFEEKECDPLILVTVHSVLSNTLRDAQNLCYSHKFARHVSSFLLPGIRKKLPVAGSVGDLRSQKTPRGILPVNSNLIFTLLCTHYYPTKCAVTFHKGMFSLPIYRNCTHILRNQHLTSAVFQALQRIRRGMTICVCRRTGNNG